MCDFPWGAARPWNTNACFPEFSSLCNPPDGWVPEVMFQRGADSQDSGMGLASTKRGARLYKQGCLFHWIPSFLFLVFPYFGGAPPALVPDKRAWEILGFFVCLFCFGCFFVFVLFFLRSCISGNVFILLSHLIDILVWYTLFYFWTYTFKKLTW